MEYKLTDKVKLEEKEFTSTDWPGVESTFDNACPAGTNYIMDTSLSPVGVAEP